MLMRQALYKLLSNAIKYRVEERALRVHISRNATGTACSSSACGTSAGGSVRRSPTCCSSPSRVSGERRSKAAISVSPITEACAAGWTIGASGRPGAVAEFGIGFAAA